MKKAEVGFLIVVFFLVFCSAGLAADDETTVADMVSVNMAPTGSSTSNTDAAFTNVTDADAVSSTSATVASTDINTAVSNAINAISPSMAEKVESAIQTMTPSSAGGPQYVTLNKPGEDVFVKTRSGEWVPAEDGMVILPGDEVRTAQGSSVEVILDGEKVGRIQIKGGSLLKVTQAETDPVTGDKKTLLDLAVGKILVKAQALKGNSQFEVRTPSAITGVRGTEFEVEVTGKLEPLT